MTQQEYEQKKRECWEEFIGTDGIPSERLRACLDFAFDRAYALGTDSRTDFISNWESVCDTLAFERMDEEFNQLVRKYANSEKKKYEKDNVQ